MSVKNELYFSISLVFPFLLSIFCVTTFFFDAKPSIVVRAELSQRHFIFRGRAYIGGCAQFIALGNLRTGENSQQSRVLLRRDSFSPSSYPAFVPAFVSPSGLPARRCTTEKTPLHVQRRQESREKGGRRRDASCRILRKRETLVVVVEIASRTRACFQPCNTYFLVRIYRSI